MKRSYIEARYSKNFRITAEELKQVYKDMGSSIGYRTKPREVTQWYVGAALLFALAAAGLSLLWTSRLV